MNIFVFNDFLEIMRRLYALGIMSLVVVVLFSCSLDVGSRSTLGVTEVKTCCLTTCLLTASLLLLDILLLLQTYIFDFVYSKQFSRVLISLKTTQRLVTFARPNI